MTDNNIDSAYQIAKQQYAAIGVDTEAAMRRLEGIPVSMHCWQGDDVGGFETAGAELSGGGIQATGNYPGKARTIAELRADIEKALSVIPGHHRLNLHACYLDHGGKYIQVFTFWDDVAGQNGWLIRPEHYRRMIRPKQKRLAVCRRDASLCSFDGTLQA